MNASEVIFREATADERAFLSEILVDAAGASGVHVPIEELASHPDTYQYVDQFPQGSDVGVIAQTIDRQLVGAAWVRMLPTDAHAINHPLPELTMGVIPPYRRRGIGAQLLVELYKAAAERGIEQLSLGVHKDNSPAIKLYQKQGWTEDGTFEEYIMMSRKTDRSMDASAADKNDPQ